MSTLEQAPESSFLFYTGKASDKVYQAHLRQKDAGWVVDYGNGPRGGTLRTGTKTATPLAYEAARKIYVRSLLPRRPRRPRKAPNALAAEVSSPPFPRGLCTALWKTA